MKRLFLLTFYLSIFSWGYAQNNSSPFHCIVAADGSGSYSTVQEAINAAPERRKEPWLIFVKNGSYREQVIIPQTKPYIHLIGQDKEKTLIHHRLNVGGKPNEKTPSDKLGYWDWSVHNPQSEVSGFDGTVVKVNGAHFYTENISYVNDWGVESQAGPQALAMSSQADCAAFSNCIFRSFQDTWRTPGQDTYRHYVKDCWIEGAVDYFYGGGTVLVEESTFYNVRSGSVIVAPNHKAAKYGYVFRNCVIDGNQAAADGKQKLGRPWHNSPRTVYIHTTMRIPIAAEGWTNMGAIPALFAEYDSRDANGKALDLSQRKTYYEGRGENPPTGSCRATISKEEADTYVYEQMIPGEDGWNPREMMKKLAAPLQLKIIGDTLRWQSVPSAIGYIVSVNDTVFAITNQIEIQLSNRLKDEVTVCAVNRYGSLGHTTSLSHN